jgi:hypothetical protein
MSFIIVFLFIGGIFFVTKIIEEKNTNIPIMIEKWDIEGTNIVMSLSFEVEEPLYLKKNLICQTFDKNQKKLGIVKKKLRGELKKSFTQEIRLGPISRKTEFIDCSFVNIGAKIENKVR